MNKSIHYSEKQILDMERQYRLNLVNSMSGFKSPVLVGTFGKDGSTNLAVMNSLMHIGANPPLLGMILRPPTVRRDTLRNIEETNQYTFNFTDISTFKNGHRTSAKFDKNQSEFYECGFKEWYTESFKAPYVESSKVKIGLELKEKHNIITNGTILIVGAVKEVIVDDTCLLQDGIIDHSKADSLAVVSLDCYFKPERYARLSHAKTYEEVHEVEFETKTDGD